MKTFTVVQGNALIARMETLVATREAYMEAKTSMVEFVKTTHITRTPECFEFLCAGIASVFGVGAVEMSATGTSLKFSDSKDGKAANNFFYREINFLLPRGAGRGKTAKQVVATPVVRGLVREFSALSKAEKTAFRAAIKGL